MLPSVYVHTRSKQSEVQSRDIVLGCDLVSIARRADDAPAFSHTGGRRCGEGWSGESLDLSKVGSARSMV